MDEQKGKLDKLNYYTRMVYETVLIHTDPVTGLFCSPSPEFKGHAWVRDNVYAIHCVWALALAYRKRTELDTDRSKGYALDHICVKVMRSLLVCFMKQADKVEAFKQTQAPKDCLHAKYSARDLCPVVGDKDWGHLQIDAISIYLLTLAQMTASGLQIVFSLDEVAFLQNLVFYIEHAYRTPDYGIWERGDKTNHGVPELNATSIGMAKAAMQALNDLDLFGAHGSPNSVIQVPADEIQQCQAVLRSLLPRESYSKETDAGLLSIISYPAFAVEDPSQISTTRATIIDKLQGRYGCRRFLRDGYKTPREDPKRLYYEPYELQKFENIECEWPLFFCYLFIDAYFNNNQDKVKLYRKYLDMVIIERKDGLKIVPELYALREEDVENEVRQPRSQNRFPAGSSPFLWAQSLYILGCLIEEGLVKLAELDPLNRRLSTELKPDTVVQVAVLAEDEEVRDKLASQGLDVELVKKADPFVVLSSQILGRMYAQLGRNAKMKLTGRKSTDLGLLGTSKMYIIENRIFVFTPQFLDWQRFYLAHDVNILIDYLKSELLYVKTNWCVPGRPLVVLVFQRGMITGESKVKQVPLGLIGALKKIQSGYISGTRQGAFLELRKLRSALMCRTVMGKIGDFVTTSCITKLHFLCNDESVDDEMRNFLHEIFHHTQPIEDRLLQRRKSAMPVEQLKPMPAYVRGITLRHKSIMMDPNDVALIQLRMDTERRLSQGSRGSRSRSLSGSTPTSPLLSGEMDEFPFQMAPLLKSPSGERKNKPLSPVASSSTLLDLGDVHCNELVEMLLETDTLEEQADIVQYLWLKQGPDWDTRLGGRIGVPVKKLVEELYQKACREQVWWLVRHTAGLLNKVTEVLTNSVTALIIRQKQVTVGMPTIHEECIVSPLPPKELLKVIKNALGEDDSGVMITQEVLIYLGSFIRTEPHLFTEMLRLRVGLIIQIMISELARGRRISGEEAAAQVTNLSPYELKTLLHHILSGKELDDSDEENMSLITYTAKSKAERTGISRLQKQLKQHKIFASDAEFEDMNQEQSINWQQWLRRRRIDGALNRVPPDFYSRIWRLLRRCEGVVIGGQVLHRNLTQEMTTGEYKFALIVESVLNKIPDPEYRQLMVEVLMVITLVNESHTNLSLGMGLINADSVVNRANEIFLIDQSSGKGDSLTCCCTEGKKGSCGGAYGICRHFYDSSPSGRYGTITYMCRGLVALTPQLGEEIECSVV